jgi:hypothetical protein
VPLADAQQEIATDWIVADGAGRYCYDRSHEGGTGIG